MNREAIARVQGSYRALLLGSVPISAKFYELLFLAEPKIRPLFPEHLDLQQAHFDAALALIVRNLEEIEALAGPLRDLGAQHLKFGAEPHHYFAARDALVGAIRALAGSSWTEELENDWRRAINQACSLMLQGAAVETAMTAERLASD